MEIDTGTPDEGQRPADVFGTEPARSGRGRRRGAAIAVGAVVIVGGGAAAALAAGTSPSATPSPAGPSSSGTPSYGPGARGEGGPGHHGRGPGGVRGLEGSALHGTLTVPSAGGYEQVLVQRGTVTAVSPTSLAVKSPDGYTHTYVLNSATRVDGTVGDTSSLAVDDTVRVLAAEDSTARIVHERGARPEGAPPAGGPEGRLPGEGLRHRGAVPGTTPEGVAPSPSTSGSSRTLPGATAGGTDT